MPIRDHNPSGLFPILTVFIILVNIVVFLIELTLPEKEFEQFLTSFALIPANVSFSNPASLLPFITSMFLHGSILHIVSNMLFLWVFGDNIEAALGKVKFFIFYFTGGIVATLAQFVFISNSNIPLLGASGAIAAVLGGYLILYPNARIDAIFPIFFIPTIIAVPASIMLAYWFIIQLFSGSIALLTQTSSTGGVAFFAHVGGFLGGIAMINVLGARRSVARQ